jgi:photosystem II stability/assembly factor-like uncharacterized protein
MMNHSIGNSAIARRSVLGFALGCGVLHAAPLARDVLARPALAVGKPERAVLLGVATAGNRLVAVGERGLIVYSDDLGASWKQAPSPVSATLTSVRFADAQRGVAVGHGGTVLTTGDGGLSWALRLDGRRVAVVVQEAASLRGDAALAAAAKRLIAEGPDKPFLDVHMASPQRVELVGAYGLALTTTDAGAHWTVWMDRLENTKLLHHYALRRRGARMVLAGEQGMVFRSGNGGAAFDKLHTPYRGSFLTAELPGDREIVVAGLRGNVWLSTDDGATWGQLKSPTGATITASVLSPDGALLFGDQAGFLLKRKDDQLVALNQAPLAPITAAVSAGERRFVVATMQGLAVVEDRQATQ